MIGKDTCNSKGPFIRTVSVVMRIELHLPLSIGVCLLLKYPRNHVTSDLVAGSCDSEEDA